MTKTKNNPLGVTAGQLKDDKILLVSYFTCYLPCPRTAFPVFYYLSLPSYLFVHSRTFSSLFYLNTFRNEMIWDLLIWQYYSFSLDVDQTFFSWNIWLILILTGIVSNAEHCFHAEIFVDSCGKDALHITLTTKFVFETSKVEILLHVANFYSLHLNALRTLSGSLKYLYNAIYYLSLYSLQENVIIINGWWFRRPTNL